ncbi:MAG: HlyD family efflux transporter periplasmic adaptor subunit [Balneolaceae bacterium]|nr:HlyD family efflux transporter periplasmic adaptor subunit [Balneolaceae bacterium]
MNLHTPYQLSNIALMLVLLLIVSSCSDEEQSDAYGQFEATETTISSEVSGKLVSYQVEEGDWLKANQRVGTVDTTRLALQRQELESQLESIRARVTNINAQVEVQRSELALARTNLNRVQAMHSDGAATDQQLDDAQAKVRTLEKSIDAQQTQKQSVRADIRATQNKIEQVNNQIQDALIVNPVAGTVLTSFAEPYEVVQQGQPLYRIANLDTLTLRVYVSGAQLPGIKLGQKVEVFVDKNAEENQSLDGKVRWIASEAEFTPQQIQTKEERVSQVYAVEVRVPNRDGILKIGMPGEVNFSGVLSIQDKN